jgi:hypothetical protein
VDREVCAHPGPSTRQTAFADPPLRGTGVAGGLGPRSSRAHLLALLALALTAGAGCGERRAEVPAPDRILLVTIDTLRADHVGCQAERRHLIHLAADGVR